MGNYCRLGDPRENCQTSLGSSSRGFQSRDKVAVIATASGLVGGFGNTARHSSRGRERSSLAKTHPWVSRWP
eukprot:3561216-Amphidinium_carterae.2